MKIFCYHASLPETSASDEAKLVKLWMERWTALGFEPFVLNEYHARQHALYAEYAKLPMGKERALQMRLLAITNPPGVSRNDLYMLSDADVIPYVKAPFMVYGTRTKKTFVPILFHEAKTFPLVLANRDHFLRMLEAAKVETLVKVFKEEGWESAPAIHYNNASMTAAGFIPRWQYIPGARTQ